MSKTNNDNMLASRQTRLIGLDLFRIFMAVVILAFHSNIHFECSYGIFTNFVSMGAVMMTGFMILSGFSLYYGYQSYDMWQSDKIIYFYKKRLIGILPAYYFVGLLYAIFFGKESFFENILLAPLEVFGLQSLFASSFGVTHNGGTWFVSCILFCYVIFPFVLELVKQLSNQRKIATFILIESVLLYLPIVASRFRFESVYANPFVRMLEFFIGILVASVFEDIVGNPLLSRLLINKISVLLELLLLIGSISAIKWGGIGNYSIVSAVVLPLLVLIIWGLAGIEWTKLRTSKIIPYLSGISYDFFLV